VEPYAKSAATFEQLYLLYRDAYFALGRRDTVPHPEGSRLGRLLPELRRIAAEVRKAK
jgi:L-ribulokinase